MTARQHSCFQSIKIDFIDSYCPQPTRAVYDRQTKKDDCPPEFLLSVDKIDFIVSYCPQTTRAVAKLRLNFDDCPPSFLLSVDLN